eukprot:TRINITY_DN17823_c0_g2_i2.p1 TRINITY_DN17823_c0_g2~~TRINITY_DN17823_c0_g2_i2.p1  ORF type:complete len:170 (-),score=37.26 TRINITY_DN17823_c0_g2_i2:93-602(-)
MRDRETRKMNEYNTRFSLDRTSSSGSPTTNDNNPGVGYLMAAVSATGQAAASVCSNGFNQAAALAACRSIGYTPGPNALYTVTTAKPSTYTINQVSCATGANKLMDCNLQYSGLGHKLSSSGAASCSGRVYLNCDPVSYTHLRAHETPEHLVCRLLLEKKNKTNQENIR